MKIVAQGTRRQVVEVDRGRVDMCTYIYEHLGP